MDSIEKLDSLTEWFDAAFERALRRSGRRLLVAVLPMYALLVALYLFGPR